MSLAGSFDAVLFDVGGVLLVPNPVYIRPAIAKHGGFSDDGAFVRGHYSGVRAMHLSATEFDDWDAYGLAYAAALGAKDPIGLAAAFRAAMVGRPAEDRWWTHVLPGVTETLAALRLKNVPIGIVSNADGSVASDLRLTSVCQVGAGPGTEMHVIVDSTVVGVAKPDPAIFDHAVPALGVADRSRIAYIGDTVRNDVVGARNAGLTPVQVDPLDLFREATWHRVTHLSEIVDWFD
jgi:putative hydrolase of the HAD superfamily